MFIKLKRIGGLDCSGTFIGTDMTRKQLENEKVYVVDIVTKIEESTQKQYTLCQVSVVYV